MLITHIASINFTSLYHDTNQGSHNDILLADTVILEFNQYPTGSRWRQTMINRKDHREVGNQADGFYGGIRKLYKEDEISMWKSLWPTQAME